MIVPIERSISEASYIVRFDDACATMNHRKWRAIEAICDRFSVRPIVGVVPDNRDPDLEKGERDPAFWETVRRWQRKGWAIGLHGHTHVMTTTSAKLILPFYDRSEFAGLPYDEQARKVRIARKIFEVEGVNPRVWIAPAHCFEINTLKALANETNINVVSDGIARRQYFESGFYWIPQQLWEFKNKKSGLWTVCFHPNNCKDDDMKRIERDIEYYAEKIISLDDVYLNNTKKRLSDRLYSAGFWLRYKLYRKVADVRARIG